MTLMGVITKDITFSFKDSSRPGYLVLPDGNGPFPGIIVIHEAFGLNENIRDVARRFAGEGYATLAVDLFSGRSRVICMFNYLTATLVGKLDHSGINELKAALTFLGEQENVGAQRLGAIGFCLGGGLAIAWAFSDQRLHVIAPFYGINPRNTQELAARSCPVVGSYPGNDFTAGMGRALQTALERAEIPNDIKVYPGASHSFFNDQLARSYNAEAAADAWERTLSFFKQCLK